ncbi:hypothetical protein D1872_327980 [compost metagenome]
MCRGTLTGEGEIVDIFLHPLPAIFIFAADRQRMVFAYMQIVPVEGVESFESVGKIVFTVGT